MCVACQGSDGWCGYENLARNPHYLAGADGARSAAKSSQSLGSSDVVVGMACAAMEGASGYSNAIRKRVKLSKAVRRQVEPAAPIPRQLSIVDVYQSLPPMANLTRWLSEPN